MCINYFDLKDVTKKYLNISFNMKINAADFILISGKNGSGKSTLIKLILGFIKPDNGELIRNITAISFLPERVELPLYMNTYEYYKAICRLKRITINLDYFNKFQMPFDKEIVHLSKGNRQKLALICTLTGNESFVILDEPLSGLDSKAKRILKNIIKKESLNKTFLISTHNPKFFSSMASKVITL